MSSFPISIAPIGLKLNSEPRDSGAKGKKRYISSPSGLKLLWIFILLIIFSLLIVFIYQLNVYTAEIYFIHNSEKRIAELSQENKILELNLAKANSLWNVGNYVQGFEKAGRLEYIRVLEGTVLAEQLTR